MLFIQGGKVVKEGDVVSFKCDVEQTGRIVAISRSSLKLEALSDEGFEGDYIGGDQYTVMDARDCWQE